MATAFLIDGVRFYRRSLVKLSPAERATLATKGRVGLHRPVEWPLPGKVCDFGRAFPDAGGSLWGSGPYLKVPNRCPGNDWDAVNRLFCPWGYPPDRLRVAWSGVYLRLESVELARVGPASWNWILSVVPWVSVIALPGHAEPSDVADGGG